MSKIRVTKWNPDNTLAAFTAECAKKGRALTLMEVRWLTGILPDPKILYSLFGSHPKLCKLAGYPVNTGGRRPKNAPPKDSNVSVYAFWKEIRQGSKAVGITRHVRTRPVYSWLTSGAKPNDPHSLERHRQQIEHDCFAQRPAHIALLREACQQLDRPSFTKKTGRPKKFKDFSVGKQAHPNARAA